MGKPGIPGYTTCKHAVNGLVKAAALEVGTLGITVNALLPGIIETDIVRETGPDSAVAMGLESYDAMISDVHEGVGHQAAEHRGAGRGGRRDAGLRRRPATSRAACSRSTAARCRTDRPDRTSPSGGDPMTARFDGQVAIVTGASGGMGRAVALGVRGRRRVRRGGRPHGGRRRGRRSSRSGRRAVGRCSCRPTCPTPPLWRPWSPAATATSAASTAP